MEIILSLAAFLIAVALHEVSHGWVAYLLGDPTAKYMGRLTLNPMAHIDIFGTIILPLLLVLSGMPAFGWAKPVPYDPANMRHPRRDAALTALAGPLANIFTAIILAVPLKYLPDAGVLTLFIESLFSVSVVLAVFNILPFPPLDGSKVLGLFIPRRFDLAYQEYLAYGVKYVILFVLFDLMFLPRVIGFSVLQKIILGAAEWVAALISLGT